MEGEDDLAGGSAPPTPLRLIVKLPKMPQEQHQQQQAAQEEPGAKRTSVDAPSGEPDATAAEANFGEKVKLTQQAAAEAPNDNSTAKEQQEVQEEAEALGQQQQINKEEEGDDEETASEEGLTPVADKPKDTEAGKGQAEPMELDDNATAPKLAGDAKAGTGTAGASLSGAELEGEEKAPQVTPSDLKAQQALAEGTNNGLPASGNNTNRTEGTGLQPEAEMKDAAPQRPEVDLEAKEALPQEGENGEEYHDPDSPTAKVQMLTDTLNRKMQERIAQGLVAGLGTNAQQQPNAAQQAMPAAQQNPAAGVNPAGAANADVDMGGADASGAVKQEEQQPKKEEDATAMQTNQAALENNPFQAAHAAHAAAAQAAAATQAQAQAGGAPAGVGMSPGDASFYNVLRMQAAQAQAEAQAQALQAAHVQAAHQAQVGSPIAAGKSAPANVQVPYMSMPPQLQAMQAMQSPESFLGHQMQMVQAAQAQAQAQAQFQARTQAQFQAQATKQLNKGGASGGAAAVKGEKKKGGKEKGTAQGKPAAQRRNKKVPKEKLSQKDAEQYLRKVKERFKDKTFVYNKFLDIMKKFRMTKIDTKGVVDMVKSLFKGHKDLLLGFNAFVPQGYEIRVEDLRKGGKAGDKAPKKGAKKKQPIEFNQAINYVNKIKKRFAHDERVYKAFLEILNMYRKGKKGIYRVYEEVSVLFGDHPDLLKEFTYFLPDSQPPPQLHAPTKRAAGKSKDTKASKRSKTKHQKDEEDKKVKLSLASLSKELQFFERVKNRLRNKEAYQDFLKCLNIFSQEIISKMELQGLVYDIIGKYPDLMQGFNEFLSRCESMDLDLSVKNILGKDGKALEAARNSVSSKEMQQKLKAISMREKYNTRPISDLDFTACEQCTPSYRKLPDDYPKMSFTGREKHKTAGLKTMWTGMLNVDWVSLPTGSEDAFGFKGLRRNQYEEALFRCEDDRFEMEMCIECNVSTMNLLEPYAKQLSSMAEEKKKTMVLPEDLLGPLHLRSIEKIYADHGEQILDLLKRIPGYAVPIVFKRLEEKDKEWRHVQTEMNKVWSKVYEQNYHKSLDHRSFYFKQVDKKNLSSKGIVSEIKELSEERKKNQNIKTKLSKAIASIPGSKWTDQHMDVDIVFECKDKAIHDEIYTIIAYAADEMLSADLSEKVKKFWREFFEPFFGLPARKPDEPSKADEEMEDQDADGDTAMGDKDSEEGGKDSKNSDDDMNVDDSGNERGQKAKEKAKEEEEEEEAQTEDSKDEESEPALDFANCKPLAAHLKEGNKGKSVKAKSVFYGNDAYYVLFRLHNFLYERLAISKECVKSVDDKWRPAQKKGAETKEEQVSKEAADANAEKLHEEFMQLVYRLIDGTTDVSQYEDECRHLLGAKAYILFTVDKLIYKLVKQIQSIVTDELLLKLQSLYSYEKQRQDNLFDDSVYYANSLVLLHDETRFRIGVMEKNKVSAQILDMSVNKCDIPAVAMDKAFSDYLKNYVELDSSTSPYEPGKIFLTRTLQGLKDMNESDEHLSAELKKFYIWNGLECKLACNTSKVSYVLDTEDIMLRKGCFHSSGTKSEQLKKQKERFEKWIESASAKLDEEST
jgi:paired amphipathic helix protein Sin3a